MRRALAAAVMLGALGVGCKKKPALVKTPVSQVAPLGGSAPAAPVEEEAPRPRQVTAPERKVTDAGVLKAAAVPAAKPTVPTAANPYVHVPGTQRLPMWKQRAKFY